MDEEGVNETVLDCLVAYKKQLELYEERDRKLRWALRGIAESIETFEDVLPTRFLENINICMKDIGEEPT